MRIAIGADHRGFTHKALVMQSNALRDKHAIEWDDVGCLSAARCDYPEYAIAVARAVQAGRAERGILFCGSGIGMSIAANRFCGVYAALVWNEHLARLAREHDCANVLIIPSDFVSDEVLLQMIDAWLSATFLGGRYQERIAHIDRIKAATE